MLIPLRQLDDNSKSEAEEIVGGWVGGGLLVFVCLPEYESVKICTNNLLHAQRINPVRSHSSDLLMSPRLLHNYLIASDSDLNRTNCLDVPDVAQRMPDIKATLHFKTMSSFLILIL